MSKLTVTDLKRRINEVDALRLEAERQMVELREQLAAAKEALAPKTVRELLEHEAIKTLEPKQINDILVGLNDQVRTCTAKRDALQAKLDTAMGLLRDSSGHIASVVNELLQCSQGDGLVAANERTALAYAALKAGHRVNAFLNTTSTEGKDHE